MTFRQFTTKKQTITYSTNHVHLLNDSVQYSLLVNIYVGIQMKTNLVKVRTMWQTGGIEVWFHSFLTSTVDGGECSVSCPGRISPGKE